MCRGRCFHGVDDFRAEQAVSSSVAVLPGGERSEQSSGGQRDTLLPSREKGQSTAECVAESKGKVMVSSAVHIHT